MPARSRASPQRPAGVRASTRSCRPGTCSRALRVSSVSIQPGSTAFTWMLSLAQADASALVSWTMPPLLTRMSSRPKALTAAPTSVRQESSRVTSATMPATLAPRSRSSAAAVSHFSLLRPTMTTVAPAAPSPRAMPRPIPPLPPVTIATLPVRSKRSMHAFLLPSCGRERAYITSAADDRLGVPTSERGGAMFAPDLLKDRRVLITGGGTGLGKAMGRRFMELGAELMICGRRQAVLDETAQAFEATFGRVVRTHSVDIRDAAAAETLMDAAFAKRPLDILVNNAAANFVARTETLSM